MEIKINIVYEQLLDIIKKLTLEEINRLNIEIEKELITRTKPKTSVQIQQLLLTAPTWTDEEYENYKKCRAHFNKWYQA